MGLVGSGSDAGAIAGTPAAFPWLVLVAIVLVLVSDGADGGTPGV